MSSRQTIHHFTDHFSLRASISYFSQYFLRSDVFYIQLLVTGMLVTGMLVTNQKFDICIDIVAKYSKLVISMGIVAVGR